MYSIDNRVILNPRSLLCYLNRPLSVINEDKHTWSRTVCTGFVRKSDLTYMTGFSDNEMLCKNLMDFWECNGLVFRKPKSSKTAEVEFFVPYFAQVPSSNDVPTAGKKDLELYMQFTDHESSQTFYQVVFILVANSDFQDSLSIQGANCAVFTSSGYHVTAFHQKIDDRIKFIFRR